MKYFKRLGWKSLNPLQGYDLHQKEIREGLVKQSELNKWFDA